MRLLLIHADRMEWEPRTKALKSAEDAEKKPASAENALVVFTSVESGDSAKTVENAVAETLQHFGQIKAERIVVYPYAHLSASLAGPAEALSLLRLFEEKLGEKAQVMHAPFGWYKSFDLKCKGHPLSELSKTITTAGAAGEKKEEVVSQSLKSEDKLKQYWYVMTPGGELIDVAKFDFAGCPKLKKFADYEISKVRAVATTPPHVKLMRSLEIADHEPGSDPGNLKFFPNGRLIKSLLEQNVTNRAVGYGAMEVETPLMYDFEHPALKSYLNRFPARQYTVLSDDKKLFLRFSACFGQFLMKSRASISYRNLPLRMFELTRYSFRREKSGELVGLRRLRAFTMPDMHTLCADMGDAKREFLDQYMLCIELMKDIGFGPEDYEVAVRFTRDFYNENRDLIASIVRVLGKPVLIEMWDQRYAYFVLKFEFNFVDALDKASSLSTVQIDVENAERYGIEYTGEDGKKRRPVVLHCSPSGAIERNIYAMLEKEWMRSEKRGALPLWLCPTQVRVIPVSDRFLDDAGKLCEALCGNGIRADIDDRTESVEKKVRYAEMEWVPYSVVVGERETASGKLAVRTRRDGAVRSMPLDGLLREIKGQVEGKPFRPLTLSRLLSRRPKFA